MNIKKLGGILAEIVDERKRQDARWGQQNHTPIEWCAILGEEVGEVNRHALQAHFDSARQGDEYIEAQRAQYRKELIEVAAVAVAMAECFDYYEES